ncbi:MAG: class II fructose-bisphosphate aldolase, partial [Chloroflexota bacterium]
LSRPSTQAQQEPNYTVTAELTGFIRQHQPPGVTIAVGAEIGEVGGRNSTVADLDAFMAGYLHTIQAQAVFPGISKLSVQTGTTHGGVLLPDGTMAQVELDFDTLHRLSLAARERYGMAGAVQHGASTLPDELFHRFPQVETAEIHLATGFQNTVYDSPHFPAELREEMYAHLRQTYGAGRWPDETDAQFLYRERKRAFGPFKEKLWNMPEANRRRIGEALEAQCAFLFSQLGIARSRELVDRFTRPVAVPVAVPALLKDGW